MMNNDTPIWQLTVGEFMDLLHTKKEVQVDVKDYTDSKYVFGISGIARLFGCSRATAQGYKKEKWMQPAISQNGRKIVVNSELALKAFNQYKKNTN
jgi:hypothetical protein